MDSNGFYGDTFSSGFGDFYTAKRYCLEFIKIMRVSMRLIQELQEYWKFPIEIFLNIEARKWKKDNFEFLNSLDNGNLNFKKTELSKRLRYSTFKKA